MATLPDEYRGKLATEFPNIPISLAERGLEYASNVYSLEQVVRLAMMEVLSLEGGINGPLKVRAMLPNHGQLAKKIIDSYLGNGPGSYGVGYRS